MAIYRVLALIMALGAGITAHSQTRLNGRILPGDARLVKPAPEDAVARSWTKDVYMQASFGAMLIAIGDNPVEEVKDDNFGLGVYFAPRASYAFSDWGSASVGTNLQFLVDANTDVTLVLPLLAGVSFGKGALSADDEDEDTATIGGFLNLGFNGSFHRPVDFENIAIQKAMGPYVDAGLRISQVELRFSLFRAQTAMGRSLVWGFGIGSYF